MARKKGGTPAPSPSPSQAAPAEGGDAKGKDASSSSLNDAWLPPIPSHVPGLARAICLVIALTAAYFIRLHAVNVYGRVIHGKTKRQLGKQPNDLPVSPSFVRVF
jgi:hypothetical protein